jgi:hypothetical protein
LGGKDSQQRGVGVFKIFTDNHNVSEVTLWGGKDSQQRGVGVLKIYTDNHNESEVTTLFQQTFKSIQTKTFISCNIFNSLDQSEKAKYIKTQMAYQNKYCKFLLKGLNHTKCQQHIKPNTIGY